MRIYPHTFYKYYNTPKCSSNIFIPIIINTIPPKRSALFFNLSPKAFPIFIPIAEITKKL